MGVIYTIACHTCRMKVDMDKWYTFAPVASRKEALEQSVFTGEDSFRAAIAIGFIYEHNGHEISVFTDFDYEDNDKSVLAHDTYSEPVDYWRTGEPA